MLTVLVQAACGGFLLAVLWFDLMFDVQVLRHRDRAELPEEVLASIAGYYRRVTTTARPMSFLVGAVMLAALASVLVQLGSQAVPRWIGVLSLGVGLPPVALAGIRVLPNAVRLGTRRDPPARQSALARAICRDHLLCLAAIVVFVGVQLWSGAR